MGLLKKLKKKYEEKLWLRIFVYTIILTVIISGFFFLLGQFVDKQYKETTVQNQRLIIEKISLSFAENFKERYGFSLTIFEQDLET